MRDLLNDNGSEMNTITYTTKLHWVVYLKPISVLVICIPVLLFYISMYWYSWKNGSYEIPEFSFRNLFILGIPAILSYGVLKNLLKILACKMTRIYLSKNYITLRTGILSKNLDDISLNKYEGLSVSQSWLGRILNYGVLAISTGEISQFYLIEKPLELRKHILEQRAVI